MMSIVTFSVFATENNGPNDDQQLLASCQALTTTPKQEKAKPCIYFIQGFLAAAQAIDPPIINQQTKKSRKFYGFMSRPYRNWEQIPPARFFPFCIPADEPKAHVITVVSKQLPKKTDTTIMLRDRIFKVLNAEYPCGKSQSEINDRGQR